MPSYKDGLRNNNSDWCEFVGISNIDHKYLPLLTTFACGYGQVIILTVLQDSRVKYMSV